MRQVRPGGTEIDTNWNPKDAIARCPVTPYRGRVWRIHPRRFDATDPNGSLRESGRYHRGRDCYPKDQAWPALYTALTPDACILEYIGQNVQTLQSKDLEPLNDCLLTELEVELEVIVNCTDPELIGLTREALTNDSSYYYTQAIGEIVNAAGYEGLCVPSATELNNNLVIFPRNLRPSSTIRNVSSREPRLRIEP